MRETIASLKEQIAALTAELKRTKATVTELVEENKRLKKTMTAEPIYKFKMKTVSVAREYFDSILNRTKRLRKTIWIDPDARETTDVRQFKDGNIVIIHFVQSDDEKEPTGYLSFYDYCGDNKE